jgi:hypothetical protein
MGRRRRCVEGFLGGVRARKREAPASAAALKVPAK